MANTCVIKRDPASKQFVVEVVDGTGAVVATSGRIVLDLDDLTASTAGYREAKFRELHFKDVSSCVEYRAWFLMTDPELVA